MAHLSFPYKLVPWHSLIHRTYNQSPAASPLRLLYMALQTQVRLRSRGNPLFRRHGTLCRDRRRGGIKPRAGRMLGARNAPTFTGRDCHCNSHLQSSRNVVTLIRRAHAASAVPLLPSVTRFPHCVPSSTPRSLPFGRFVAVRQRFRQFLLGFL